jgi:hypothetical protein
MIELVFVACLWAQAADCAEHSLLRVHEAGLSGCMATAQAQIAHWGEAHPGHRIVRWSCRWADASERDA